MAAHTQDDGFHEIQLNGKQLVFFFMATTVVLVVVFLCGVLVGRGVRAERGGASTDVATIEPTVQQPAAVVPSAGSDPTKAAPPPPAEEVLTYTDRLQKSKPPADVLNPPAKAETVVVSPPVEKAPVPVPVLRAAVPPTTKPAPQPASKAASQAPAKEPVLSAAPSASPSSSGSTSAYVVQVAALNVRSEADAIAKRLSSKGYDAYVLESAPGTPQVYRVRVGKFGSRRDAQTMAAKLQKEEQFKPWVTR